MSTAYVSKKIQPHSSLKAWRRARGFRQHEAAAYLGISQSYYCKLEAHVQTPRPQIAKQLVAQTGVPLDELLGIAD